MQAPMAASRRPATRGGAGPLLDVNGVHRPGASKPRLASRRLLKHAGGYFGAGAGHAPNSEFGHTALEGLSRIEPAAGSILLLPDDEGALGHARRRARVGE